ncbi:hypothetical protein EMIT0133MI5_150013 [Bacillus velezensis]
MEDTLSTKAEFIPYYFNLSTCE